MTEDRFKNMDPYILLSMVNMKLRDSYSSLEAYCEDENISEKTIIDRLGSIGYSYIRDVNQFK